MEPQEQPTAPRPEPIAKPPVLDPRQWEDFEGFRETFLLNFTDPVHNAALRTFGRLLYHLSLEAAHVMPIPEEGWIHTHLRAVLADLRFIEGFLAFLGGDGRKAGSPPDEASLCRAARRMARSLRRTGDALAMSLQKES